MPYMWQAHGMMQQQMHSPEQKVWMPLYFGTHRQTIQHRRLDARHFIAMSLCAIMM